jgi:hypothetical protein
MTSTKPAATSQTKLDNAATLDVKVAVKRTVRFVFEIVSTRKLRIPYAVSIAGKVRDEFKKKPKLVSGDKGSVLVENVEPGQEVCLFLNSDAQPAYRAHPVYAVTPQDRDIVVEIKEKLGKHRDTDRPVALKSESSNQDGSSPIETYSATLTGDIWMKVSHRYAAHEVDELLSPNTDRQIVDAVRSIYQGLKKPSLQLNIGSGTAERKIGIVFSDGDNPRDNIISGYELLSEGLTRVHPAGYAAIFAAAVEAGVDKVVMTSCWRPMLGSIAHRAGLGVDVAYIGPTLVNRKELRKRHSPHTSNVSEKERQLFTDLESALEEQSAARKALRTAENNVKNAGFDSGRLVEAKQKLAEATEANQKADKRTREAEAAWNDERNKNEPAHVRQFRASLLRCERVSQVFDPWLMDINTHDDILPLPNTQRDDNETLHGDHLHITIHEPKII